MNSKSVYKNPEFQKEVQCLLEFLIGIRRNNDCWTKIQQSGTYYSIPLQKEEDVEKIIEIVKSLTSSRSTWRCTEDGKSIELLGYTIWNLGAKIIPKNRFFKETYPEEVEDLNSLRKTYQRTKVIKSRKLKEQPLLPSDSNPDEYIGAYFKAPIEDLFSALREEELKTTHLQNVLEKERSASKKHRNLLCEFETQLVHEKAEKDKLENEVKEKDTEIQKLRDEINTRSERGRIQRQEIKEALREKDAKIVVLRDALKKYCKRKREDKQDQNLPPKKQKTVPTYVLVQNLTNGLEFQMSETALQQIVETIQPISSTPPNTTRLPSIYSLMPPPSVQPPPPLPQSQVYASRAIRDISATAEPRPRSNKGVNFANHQRDLLSRNPPKS